MKKLKIPLAIMGIMIAITGAFAFKAQHATVKKDPVTYHYKVDSDLLADMKNINNWEVAEPGCGDEGDIPCAITYDGNFATYLSGFTSPEALTAAATERRFIETK